MKRAGFLLLAGLCAAVIVHAAGQKETGGAGATGNVAAKDTSPLTLTAFYNYPKGVEWKWGDDALSRYITERTGVTVDIRFATTNDSVELNTMLASGQKLPDFIIADSVSPVGIALMAQKFVQPINRLADQYSPDFWKVLPSGYKSVYTEEDGNLYYLLQYFGDIDRRKQLDYSAVVASSIAYNKPVWEAAGKPSMETLEDFRSALKVIKAKDPNVTFPMYDGAITDATNERNAAQIFYRIYGGTSYIDIDKQTGTVTLNFKDPRYLDAVKYINTLYRDGTFNKENFTMNQKQYEEAALNNRIFAYVGQWYLIALVVPNGVPNGPYWAMEWPTAPNVPRSQQKRVDHYGSLVTGQSVMISKDTQKPARAIQYLTWMLSDEGQVAIGWQGGVPGKHTTMQPGNHGLGVPTATKELLANPNPASETGYGYVNWLPEMFWNRAAVPNWLVENPVGADEYRMATKYSHIERLEDLVAVIKDESTKVIYAKVVDLWNRSLAEMYTADSTAGVTAAYQRLLAGAESLNVKQLEQYYAANYKKWIVRDPSLAKME